MKALQHIGWIIAGAIALVAVGVFVVGAMGNYGRIKNARTAIDNQGMALTNQITTPGFQPATQQQIDGWAALRGQMAGRYSEGTGFYSRFDAPLDVWVTGGAQRPSPDQFFATYTARGYQRPDSLEATLRGATPPIQIDYPTSPRGVGGQPPAPRGLMWENTGPEAVARANADATILPALNTRFWIRNRVVNAILQGHGTAAGLGVERLLEVRFISPIAEIDSPVPPPTTVQAFPGMIRVLDFPQGPLGPFLVPMGAGNALQIVREPFLTQSQLARTVTFGVALVLPARSVPAFLARLMDTNTEPAILVNVIAWRVSVFEQNDETREVFAPAGQAPAVQAQAQADIHPKPVVLMITAQALDFDPTKVQHF